MTHDQLIKLSSDREFEFAKPMIMEGISARLTSFEKSDSQQTAVKTQPRVRYEEPRVLIADESNDSPQSLSKVKYNPFL